jgi:hypothetical protein
MSDDLQLLDPQPAVIEPPTKPVPKPRPKRRATPPPAPSEMVLEQPVAEALPASSQKPRQSKPRQPFTPGERAAIERLARNGVAPNEIAKAINRGSNHPQVALYVRQLGLAAKQTSSVPVVISDSKVTCSGKTWAALAAAARRRSVEPAMLAVQIIDGVLRRGSVDAVTNSDGELVDDLRTVQLVLNLEAVGRANGDGTHAPRDYRLRGVALAHGERAG